MGITYKGYLYKEPYRLSKEINTFDKYLDNLFKGNFDDDHHFLPQKKPDIAFDQILEISEIKNIFKDIDDNLSYKYLFNPIAEKLPNSVSRIYLKNDGIFNNINLETLLVNDRKEYFFDKYNFEKN